MHFSESLPIYLQIARHICEKVILHEWKSDDRVPSVRDLAVDLEVNPNTVLRTYEFLQQKDIIVNSRGIGYFVAEKSRSNALAWLKEEFTGKEMNYFFRTMAILDMEPEDIAPYFHKFRKKTFSNYSKKHHEKK